MSSNHDHGEARSSDLLRSYRRSLFWSRLMYAAFFTVFAGALLWAMPWLPYGLEKQDYHPRTAFLLILLSAAWLTALGAVYLRGRSRRVEQTLLTWTTVQQGLSDRRRREYFYDRIVIECERAKMRRGEFTVVALRIEPNGDEVFEGRKLELALGALEPLIRDYDCLAALGPHEIGVLAPRITGDDAEAFAESLCTLVREALAGQDAEADVHAGWAVFGAVAPDAGELVGLARSNLARRQYAA